jgi:hypothetical protein
MAFLSNNPPHPLPPIRGVLSMTLGYITLVSEVLRYGQMCKTLVSKRAQYPSNNVRLLNDNPVIGFLVA